MWFTLKWPLMLLLAWSSQRVALRSLRASTSAPEPLTTQPLGESPSLSALSSQRQLKSVFAQWSVRKNKRADFDSFGSFLGLMIHLMPESPRWLEARGRRDQAKAAVYSMCAWLTPLASSRTSPTHYAPLSLSELYGVASEQEEEAAQGQYQEIADAVESEAQHAQAKWRDCFRPGPQKMLYRTLLGMALQSFQQLTGANYFL